LAVAIFYIFLATQSVKEDRAVAPPSKAESSSFYEMKIMKEFKIWRSQQ
jgi:hypothetical protein